MKSIVDGVFGKGESIKIVLKNYLENKSILEVVKEFKFFYLKFKLIIEMMVEMKEKEIKEKEI